MNQDQSKDASVNLSQNSAESADRKDVAGNVNNAPEEKDNSKKTIILVLGIVFGSIILVIVILAIMVWAGLGSARNKAKDARIKADISSMRASTEMYYEDHNQSYKDWQPDQIAFNSIGQSGSRLFYKTTEKTYMIFARLPGTKKYFCVDSNNVSIELDSVDTNQNTCQ